MKYLIEVIDENDYPQSIKDQVAKNGYVRTESMAEYRYCLTLSKDENKTIPSSITLPILDEIPQR